MTETLETPWIVVVVLCVLLAGLLVYVFVKQGGLPRLTRERPRARPVTEEYELRRPRRQDRYAQGSGYSPLEPKPSYSRHWA